MVVLARLLRLRNDDGQALIEYALIVTLIVVVVLIVIIAMGNQVHNMYCNISGGLAS
jgi:Flp pilus assembly pilin Flp